MARLVLLYCKWIVYIYLWVFVFPEYMESMYVTMAAASTLCVLAVMHTGIKCACIWEFVFAEYSFDGPSASFVVSDRRTASSVSLCCGRPPPPLWRMHFVVAMFLLDRILSTQTGYRELYIYMYAYIQWQAAFCGVMC